MLVKEEDDRGVTEPFRVDGCVEQRQALLHAILKPKRLEKMLYTTTGLLKQIIVVGAFTMFLELETPSPH